MSYRANIACRHDDADELWGLIKPIASKQVSVKIGRRMVFFTIFNELAEMMMPANAGYGGYGWMCGLQGLLRSLPGAHARAK